MVQAIKQENNNHIMGNKNLKHAFCSHLSEKQFFKDSGGTMIRMQANSVNCKQFNSH